jgi:large subunit ribosomal protein L15
MELNKLPKTTKKRLRRLGQGHGSGRGKTAGRGTKGQKARGKVKPFFEGGALPLVKRLPFLRGRGRNVRSSKPVLEVNIAKLNSFRSGANVDIDSLIKSGILSKDAKKYGAKIIGNGELKNALTVKIPVTNGAKKKIEKAGGRVEVMPQNAKV